MKAVLFNKLGMKYPGLGNLSAKRFSKLTRKELYSIAVTARNAGDDPINYFRKYNSQTTEQLAQNAYNWAKEAL